MSSEKRSITIEDVSRIQYVEDPQLSPDGRWIAYVQMKANMMKRGYDRNIYLVATDGGAPFQITFGGKDTTPRWSPDGRQLAFVSARAEKPQIYLLPTERPGEARTLTSHENGAVAPAWSPDGTRIAYLSASNALERADEDSDEGQEPPRDELEAKHRKERKAEDEKNRFEPRPVDRIPYRQGTAYLDDRHTQIYVIRTEEGLPEDEARPRRLTDAAAAYAPPQWSPDGKTLYTTRAYDTEADEYFRYSNIYKIDVESGTEERIVDEEHTVGGVLPSPDGRWLVCTRRLFGKTDDLPKLTLIPLDGGEPVALNAELDRGIVEREWTAESQLFVQVENEGRGELHLLNPETREFSPLIVEEQAIYGISIAEDGAVAYVSRTTTRLDELFYRPADGAPQQLTQVNEAFMDEIEVLETREIRYQNPHGQELQGWYILPKGYEEGKQYPLALNIHGGPHVMWSPSARAMWHEWQVHAAAGYVVFFCNPRGSDGYGQDHLDSLHADWGRVAMEDIMAGVDAMIAKGFVDADRMAITGGSYGGYMTSWIIGHTQRFKAAVTQRGVYNLTSFYGTSDVPILISSEFDVEPWEDHATLWEHSPLAYASQITTPTLIIHAENDFRVPIEQAEQLFAWIRRATDTPVRLLRYPREGHELSRSGEPQHRISRLQEMLDWFNQYCQPETDQAPV